MAVASLLAMMVVAASLLRPPRPVAVVTVGAHYATNLCLPHNAYGWAGLNEICQLTRGGDSLALHQQPLLFGSSEPVLAEGGFTWKHVLQGLDSDKVVLVVSLHGGADRDGPYLYRNNESPDHDATKRLRVRSLLSALAEQPAGQEFLVVFDATASTGDWSYGSLRNEFADGLRAMNDAIAAQPNLTIVSASDVSERSWPSLTTGRTLFLDALIEGFRGAADDEDRDGRLDGVELLKYVQSTVAAKSSVDRQRTQSMLVLPLGVKVGAGSPTLGWLLLTSTTPRHQRRSLSCRETSSVTFGRGRGALRTNYKPPRRSLQSTGGGIRGCCGATSSLC